jgi:hypothetical protein
MAGHELQQSGQLDGEVLRGSVTRQPQPLLAPGAYSIVVDVEAGTLWPGASVRLAPLPSSVHPALSGLVAGQRVVVTRVGLRGNGSLYPLLQTVLLTEDEIDAT